MRREDLQVFETFTAEDGCLSGRYRPVTDAELAELGLVALDGIDVEALRRSAAWFQEAFDDGRADYLSSSDEIWKTVRQVLAAIDQGGHTMTHEMRLYTSGGRCWAYCGCGWLGRAWNADMPEKSQGDFRRHLAIKENP